MNSRQYDRMWNAVRGLKERFRSFESALSRHQGVSLVKAAASLVDAERRVLNVYYQEQSRDRPVQEGPPTPGSEDLMKAVSGLASVNDQVLTAVFIAAESDLNADERARAIVQRAIDEHRRLLRDLIQTWDRSPRPRV